MAYDHRSRHRENQKLRAALLAQQLGAHAIKLRKVLGETIVFGIS